MASLFLAMRLMVSSRKDEVQHIDQTCLEPQWDEGMEDIINRIVIGKGLAMGEGPWHMVGVGDSPIQTLIIWSSSSPS